MPIDKIVHAVAKENESIKDIWNKREIGCFRDLEWIQVVKPK